MNIEKISNNLLELTKRNRLLNFKDSGLKSINILNKNIDEIFRNILDGKTFSLIQIEKLLERQKNLTDPTVDIKDYSPSKVYDIVSVTAKDLDLICYKKGYTQNKVFTNLYREYKEGLNEKGINMLYIAFGFIEYIENDQLFNAPILLIPLTITNEKTYKIKCESDDVILNPTLSYYLKTTYNINLLEYNDENILDYLAKLKNCINDMKINTNMAIGIFSFQKMNMYNDLVNNQNELFNNINIKALYGNGYHFTDERFEDLIYPVVDCDRTQLESIRLATSGQSFVLQGPPGSGKSQTITNIIASLIANGRRVLFVSEKLAALQVVYENLKRVGLEEFALEMHSSKGNKKDFIDNIYLSAIKPKYKEVPTAVIKTDYHNLEKALNEYIDLMHAPIDENITLKSLIDDYVKINKKQANYRFESINNFNDLKKYREYLNTYYSLSKTIGNDYRKLPYYGLKDTSFEFINYELSNLLDKSIIYLNVLKGCRQIISTNVNINKAILSNNDIQIAVNYIDDVLRMKEYNPNYFDKDIYSSLTKLINEYDNIISNRVLIDSYETKILDLELEADYRYFKVISGFKRLFDKRYKEIKYKLLSYRNKSAKHDELLKDFELLIALKESINKENNILDEINNLINCKDIDIIKANLEIAKNYIGYSINLDNINELTDAVIKYKNYASEEISFNSFIAKFDSNLVDFSKLEIDQIIKLFTLMNDKKENINYYSNMNKLIDDITIFGDISFINQYFDEANDIDDLLDVFNKTALLQLIMKYVEKYDSLKHFISEERLRKITDYSNLDETILSINKNNIISRISKNRPDMMVSSTSPFGIIKHEYNKSKKRLPIRMVMSQAFDFITKIKPVFLMSPLSVSTFLESKCDLFDTVIFDEASQIFASDALGSIYRAKQCIIIGDSKQMPPTAFFSGSAENEDEYEELESILDLASSCFKTASLKWHYRSRSEELIAFSNKNFYNDMLISIPSAKSHTEGFGIDFKYLTDGRYNQDTRTNLKEANLIADMVIDHYKNSDLSLGVVAFSKVQADLIYDLVEERLRSNPELIDKLSIGDYPFFVKNLETVQGDERDRIIFSICYGYNDNEKFYQRFGPLNNVGGEKRLNVAITRAKYNITVVSSIKYTDIKDSQSEGAMLLKEYLKFAEQVSIKNTNIKSEEGLISVITKILTDEGYFVDNNYGTSSFRIPIAVKKANSNDYYAAIMVDSSADLDKNSTENYRLEQALIKRQGWKYYRVYNLAWLLNFNEEKYKLLSYLNDEIDEYVNDIIDSVQLVKEDKSSIDEMFEQYKYANLDSLKDIFEEDPAQAIKNIIDVESPIHINYLAKHVAYLQGKKTVTNVVKNFTLKNIDVDYKIERDFVYKTYNELEPLRLNSDRVFDEISDAELKDGLYKIIEQNVTISKDEAYSVLISLLGYSKLMPKYRSRLDDIVIFLKLLGKIVENNNILSI